jgi:hypothetical protein
MIHEQRQHRGTPQHQELQLVGRHAEEEQQLGQEQLQPHEHLGHGPVQQQPLQPPHPTRHRPPLQQRHILSSAPQEQLAPLIWMVEQPPQQQIHDR